MRRVLIWLIGLIPVIAAAACGSAGYTVTGSQQGHVYRDAAGWTIKVPPGWHVLRFSDSKDGITAAGVQLSNVKLPPPKLGPGFPIQANGGVLPTHGVGVVIASDTDPKVPHGATFTATTKIGPKATNGDPEAFAAIVQSLR
jgi:hypothetical protein